MLILVAGFAKASITLAIVHTLVKALGLVNRHYSIKLSDEREKIR